MPFEQKQSVHLNCPDYRGEPLNARGIIQHPVKVDGVSYYQILITKVFPSGIIGSKTKHKYVNVGAFVTIDSKYIHG